MYFYPAEVTISERWQGDDEYALSSLRTDVIIRVSRSPIYANAPVWAASHRRVLGGWFSRGALSSRDLFVYSSSPLHHGAFLFRSYHRVPFVLFFVAPSYCNLIQRASMLTAWYGFRITRIWLQNHTTPHYSQYLRFAVPRSLPYSIPSILVLRLLEMRPRTRNA